MEQLYILFFLVLSLALVHGKLTPEIPGNNTDDGENIGSELDWSNNCESQQGRVTSLQFSSCYSSSNCTLRVNDDLVYKLRVRYYPHTEQSAVYYNLQAVKANSGGANPVVLNLLRGSKNSSVSPDILEEEMFTFPLSETKFAGTGSEAQMWKIILRVLGNDEVEVCKYFTATIIGSDTLIQPSTTSPSDPETSTSHATGIKAEATLKLLTVSVFLSAMLLTDTRMLTI